MFLKMKQCRLFSTNVGLLVLRIGIGALFIFAGWMKVQDMTATVTQFGSMGFSPFWAYVASIAELVGGIAVLFGIFTRIAAFILSVVMVVALVTVWGNMNMIMTPAITLFATLSLFCAGGGRFSIIRRVCGCGTCPVCMGSDVEVKN